VARKRKLSEPSVAPEHESGVRSLIAQAHGEEHVAYRSLSEAKFDADGVVVFEGDYGGQIYLVARARFICCPESQLQKLLSELDALGWADPDGARVYFESLPVGAGVAGGMGGGTVAPEVWLHPKLTAHEAAVRGVLLGERASINQ
jgi:hypothetical protein